MAQRSAILLASLLILSPFCSAEDVSRRKKLIATGWNACTTENLAERMPITDTLPFDGIVIRAKGRDEQNKPRLIKHAFVDQKWERAWFDRSVADLKAAKFKNLTDNFLLISANPGNVDWFDDEGWANIVEHCRIAAWIARQGGLKGIVFDAEAYVKPWRIFHYKVQPQHDQHTFIEYNAKARQRGRQVMEGVTDEFPGITWFTYRMHIANTRALEVPATRVAKLKKSTYGLYRPFIDGWLDVAGPQVTFVDGCEKSYHFNNEQQFLEAANLIRGDCQLLVAPENRAKYRGQVQIGFGIYLDAHWNPRDSEYGKYYIDGPEGPDHPRISRLRANVSAALRISDQYVWLYGEKFSWWPYKYSWILGRWTEALPGCVDIFAALRDPVGYARQQYEKLKEAGAENLVHNGDFNAKAVADNPGKAGSGTALRAPPEWHAWEWPDSPTKGVFSWDHKVGGDGPGSARIAGMTWGCFDQTYAAQPGEQYVIRAMCKQKGRGVASIRVRWQTPKRKWILQDQDVIIHPSGPRGNWREMFGVVPIGIGPPVAERPSHTTVLFRQVAAARN